jgi:hypothetical protein
MDVREFSFIRETSDYDRAAEAVSSGELDSAEAAIKGIPSCGGILRVRDSRIGRSTDTAPESIEWLYFEVELCGGN